MQNIRFIDYQQFSYLLNGQKSHSIQNLPRLIQLYENLLATGFYQLDPLCAGYHGIDETSRKNSVVYIMQHFHYAMSTLSDVYYSYINSRMKKFRKLLTLAVYSKTHYKFNKGCKQKRVIYEPPWKHTTTSNMYVFK